ncbi:glycosyltransferase family 2 protein [Pasteurella sp. PK-2025]|uniref:glycosyltransferase family 2 protein n=2 Tax=Pasteurella TaxID=745 RepID=UPI003C7698BC
MKLTILMPCLNEVETLEKCINKAKSWIVKSGVTAEILISDNGSTDGSQVLATQLGARVVNAPEKGYGAALIYGAKAAKGQYIIMGDADDSYDFSELDAFMDKLQQGYDLVMGNRFLGGIEEGAMPWKNKYIGNPVLSAIGRLLFKCPAKDFHCGLRGFSKAAFEKMDLRTSGMEFASEMVIKANLLKMKIAEVPTTLSKDGRSRPPHLKPWRDGWRHLRFMLLFSPKWLFIYPSFIISLFSLIAYCALLMGPVETEFIRFDMNTLLFVQCFLVVGILCFCFGTIVHLFAIREGLLPENRWMTIIQEKPVLEWGMVFSFILMIIGGVTGFDSIFFWINHSFGDLEVGTLIRTISLSTLSITLGFIWFFMSCIAGFLALPKSRI